MYLWIEEMFLALAGKFEQLSYTCTWKFQVSLSGFQPMSHLLRRLNLHHRGHGFNFHWRHLKFFRYTGKTIAQIVLQVQESFKLSSTREDHFLQFISKLHFTKISFIHHSFHRSWTGIAKVMGSNHVEIFTLKFFRCTYKTIISSIDQQVQGSTLHLHTSLTFLSYMCIYLPVW